ncbi:putative sporulation protein YtxC [Alkalihalobacterium chitinilyticum]|uniref:Sporulation protein YtxC n=1 Tax=Alkalihalobacterium chitinilyticum TaxID=2980103 RepID=A0ABT5VB38_9BACI|nr:putative sporulation protein YtxC [Alkalihalobacterium chitinilyticum]MDE5412351.1 putative sporulation protein YtxC [Alkalihalobacterium chitinilyticum]
MIAIQFESQQDCQQVYNQLTRYMSKYTQLGLQVTLDIEEGEEDTTIYIQYEDDEINFYDSFHPLLASVLSQHVIETKEEDWLLEIIEHMFYFNDPEEQEQILSLACEIINGDREDIPAIHCFYERENYLYEAFAKGIDKHTTFYYEPFLTFRLKDYGEILIDCVEIAIDEYLLEQEYQNIVESLRYYLKTAPKKMKELHLVHDGEFSFYDGAFKEISREEKELFLEEALVFEGDLDIDEMVVSPLVSINPETLHIYTDDVDQGIIYTLQTIFQERAVIYPLGVFHRVT